MNHGFQHLCRHHSGLADTACCTRNLLLANRYRFQRQFDAQIAARYHQCVGQIKDFSQPVQCFWFFDLREHRRPARDELSEFRNIIGTLNKRERNPIDPQIEGGVDIAAVLFRQSRNGKNRVG